MAPLPLDWSAPMRSILQRYPLAAVLLAGSALRAVFFAQFSRTPFHRHPLLDCAYYHDLARAVADGTLVQPRAFFFGPLYSYVLGGLYAVFGARLWIAPGLQMLLGLATCALLYRLGTRLFSRAVGLLAALLYAVFEPVLFYEQTLLVETMLAFACLVFLDLVLARESESAWRWLGAGFALGLAALLRANVLLFLPVLLIWLAKRQTGARGDQAAGGDRPAMGPSVKRRAMDHPWRRPALVVAGTLLAVLPATIHNYAAEKDLVWISANDGINLFIGNHAQASGSFEPPPGVSMDADMPGARFAERALGRSPLRSSEVSAYWRARALDFVRESPGRALTLLARKAYYFWGAVELDQIFSVDRMAALMPVLRWPLPGFRLLAPLALAGMVLLLGTKRHRLLVWFVLAYMVSLLPFFIVSRYRLPVVPVLCLFAACALVRWTALIQRKEWKKAIAAGAAVLALLVPLDDAWAIPPRQLGEIFHNSLGLFYLSERRLDLAEQEFRSALETGAAPEIYANLAWVCFLKKDYECAVENYSRADAMNPQNPETCFRLGLSYLCLARLPEARRHLERAIALDPNGDPLCYYNLAVVYWSQNEPQLAERAMRAYLQRNPQDRQAREMLMRASERTAPRNGSGPASGTAGGR